MSEITFGLIHEQLTIDGETFNQKQIAKQLDGKMTPFWKAARNSIEQTMFLLNDETGIRDDVVFEQQFLWHMSEDSDDYVTLITDEHKGTLEDYIRNNRLTEANVLAIFDDVLKAIYSLHNADYCNANVRPDQFVRKGSQWKMESMVYDMSCTMKELKS